MSRYHDLYAAFNKAKRESEMPEVRRWHDDECISVCTSLAVAMTAYIEPDSAIQFQYNIETEYTTRRTTLVIGVQLPNLKILHLHIDVSKDKNDYILKLHRTNEEFRISNTTAEDFRPVLQAAYLLLEKLAVAAGQHIHEP